MQPRRIEVWSLPDDALGFRSLLELPYLAGTSWQDPDNTPGKGTVVLDPEWEHLDDILLADPTTPEDSLSALLAIFREDSEIPDFEFFADQRIDPIGPGQTTISGPDIRSGLNDGKIHPRAPDDPIWLWGQKTLTRNSDLTEGTVADEEFDVWISSATAGFWRIDLGASGWSAPLYISAQAIWTNATGGMLGASFGGDPTSWAWNASDATVASALEALPDIVDVTVTGTGTAADPWIVAFINPSGPQSAITLDATSLTPGGSFGFWEDRTATAARIKEAIEAGPSTVIEVNVTGGGTIDSPWKIHPVDPPAVDYSVQVDDASLTGDIFVRFLTDGGDVRPTYYTPAQTIGGVLFGVMGTFRVEIDPLDGLPSILVAGNSPFIGAQQPLQGVLGLHGYADVQIRPLIYGDRFRIGVRDIDEGWLYTVEADLVTGSYQTITIPYPMVLAHDQVILRAAGIGDNPPDFYIRNLNLYPGMPGTDWGDIVGQLMTSIQARGGLTWLDLTLVTPGVDSNAVAWDNPSLAFRADPGMDMGTHVMADGHEGGYEYDIVRLAPPFTVGNPTHQLLIYNRLGRGETPTTDPAVIVGDIDNGQIAKRRILFTHLLVEYAFPAKFVEVTNAIFAGMSRREGYLRAEQALDEATAIQMGDTYLLSQIDDLLAVQITPTSVEPYRDLDIGWQIPYELGKHAGRHIRRIHTIAARYGDDWSAELTASELFSTDEAAHLEATRRLQEAFDRRERREARPLPPMPPGCCPSCLARANGTLQVVSTNPPSGTFDWFIDNDPDQILVETPNGNLAFVKPGLYTVHLVVNLRWTTTAAGWAMWDFASVVSGNDAGDGRQTVTAARSLATFMNLNVNLSHPAHTALANQAYNAFWSRTDQQSAGLIDTSSGVLINADLSVVRHSNGCARVIGSGE